MEKLENKKIAIIGMGHMGKALVKGLIHGGFKKENILVSNDSSENKKVAEQADWIILAVKPLSVQEVLQEITSLISEKILFSIAAGVSMQALAQMTTSNQKIIRLMPNLLVQYAQGIVGYHANTSITSEEKETTIGIFSGLGKVIECNNEDELDAITVIAGCGPALVAYFISLLRKSGQKLGLRKEVANSLTWQTFLGTLTLMEKANLQAEELQTAVATKGGITESIINSLDEKRFLSQFVKSLEQGYVKIKKIRQEVENKQ